MLQALDRFKLEAKTRLTGIHHLNVMLGFLNPHALLQSESHNGFTNAVKSTYEEEVNVLELAVEIDRFKRLVRSGETTFDVRRSNAQGKSMPDFEKPVYCTGCDAIFVRCSCPGFVIHYVKD
ncbi:unnamed protein product [Clavelina lepadiformis]|uniref:Uncharacterized protein n=1 Tax=Clavelina lepadiformis TaxID=159417 RepID=A0ABP0FZT6_CLALP